MISQNASAVAGYLLKNGVIFDGSGKPPLEGDVLTRGGKIVAVGEIPHGLVPPEANLIDLKGLGVSPGFINIHSHSDTDMLVHPDSRTLLMQGITTEIVGNCGSGAVYTGHWTDDVWNGLFRKSGLEEKWNGVRGYLEAVRTARPAVNVGTLFGHGDVRRQVVGDDGRLMTREEKRRAREISRAYMQEGAFGVSSGLEYLPGRFADVHELAAVSEPVREYGGFHASHLRNEGPDLLESIREIVDVGKKSGVRVEVSHIKACGPENWGKVKEALTVLDSAPDIEMAADFYPYLASSTELAIVLPDWVLDKGKKVALETLRNPEIRRKAEEDSHRRTLIQGGWDKVVITGVGKPENKWMEGKNLEDISSALGQEPQAAAVEILLRESMEVRIARFAIGEDDLIEAMKHSNTCVVTDGYNTAPEDGKTHPRSVGAFPRLLGYYARERGIISMQEAVRKMTSLPAERLRLSDRGLLMPGYWADMVIFDIGRVTDRATYDDPWQYPEGIQAVFVNGEMAAQCGELTGRRHGMPLYHRSK